jgi:hypothetical protein
MWNEPSAVFGQPETVPVKVKDVSPEAIELVRVHAAAAPAYDRLLAYAI